MSKVAEEGPAVVCPVGDSVALGEVGAGGGAGRGVCQSKAWGTVFSGEGARSPDSCGQE